MLNWFKTKSFSAGQPKSLGQRGEELAQKEYRNRGFKIVAANFFNRKGKRLGEIDFIAKTREKIIFVEVKTRTGSSRFGTGAEAVDALKQRKILKAVKVFLSQNPEFSPLQPQIDVCLVTFGNIDKGSPSVIILANAVEDWN